MADSFFLQLGSAAGDQADHHQRLLPRIPQLMLLITGNEHHLPGPQGVPLPIAENLARASVDEHLMFPGMGMQRGMAARRDLKAPHIKIFRAVRLAQDHPGRDPFSDVTAEEGGLDFGVFFNFHDYHLAPKISNVRLFKKIFHNKHNNEYPEQYSQNDA
jgi:hypothetical protein